jgi:hypothetical protein
MGFWDVRLADLEAAGEVFTDEEVEVMEEGGKVLHLHPLETPDIEVMDWCTYADGEVVVVPEMADVYGPHQSPPSWVQQHEHAWPDVATFLDDNFDWHGGRSMWTDIPRYAGELTHEHYICGVRCEELTGFVFWNCWPISASNQHLADQILAAGIRFVDEGLWWQAEWLCRQLYDGEYDLMMPWLMIKHPERVKAADLEVMHDSMSYLHGRDYLDELKVQASMFQDLYDARVIDVEDNDLADLAHGQEYRLLPFGSLPNILHEAGCHEAADLYRSLLSRRRRSIARYQVMLNHRGIAENEVLE